MTCDAYHVSTPQAVNGSAARAIKQSLERSGLESGRYRLYSCSRYEYCLKNDRHEANLIKHIFPQRVAVSSSKGATGHTLGASGAINTALTLMAMKHGYLPPCVGLKDPEFDIESSQNS